ncbi:TonB-dependent receptor [Marinibactrum halimedae]|uniref:TonB-dependent receptor n=1 Tax=Marinibactrum halimedae TaxID=1444977 RepID=A0AA37WMJ0_9GAMM|nr:TonB-dependent receptor [Marinibactrum halimedae]MCD9459232.1 TonB-dependent receptor [Marinibactrum halimedae]GLS27304.1 TonB-dependent receptor [Marinibactrum halimedae]
MTTIISTTTLLQTKNQAKVVFHNRAFNVRPLLLAAAITSIVVSEQIVAQNTDIEEVIVTATKRASTIQDVPFSINAQTSKDIERSGATNLEELSRNVAGLAIQNLGPGQSQVSVRGVSAGQIVRDQPGVKEQVGVYLDESVISLSLFTPDLDLYDLNRVETLRGPQGTLFGSGSVGGTIRYITNQPNLEETEGSLELNLNAISDGESGGHAKGMVNLPFAEGTGAVRAVFYHTEYAGFIDAKGPAGGDDVNSGTRTGGRVALTLQPNENFSITPRVIFQNIETDGNNRTEAFNFLASASGVTLGDREQFLLLKEGFEDDTLITDLTATISTDIFEVTSITSYTEREILVSRDASALSSSVSLDALGLNEVSFLIPSNLRDSTDVEQTTQELRLSTNSLEVMDVVVGVFYSDTERQYRQRLPTPGYDAFVDAALGEGTSAAVANGYSANSPYNADIPYDLEQLSAFGEVSVHLGERWSLTFGTRYYDYEETRTFNSGGIFSNSNMNLSDETASHGFNSRFLASFDATEDLTLNFQVSEGFRLGGVNDPLNANLCEGDDLTTFGSFQSYDDETLTNIEFGLKARFPGVQLNAAIFHADIDDLQVTLDAGSCSSRISFNVEEAHSTGIELELKAQPTDRIDLSLAASSLEAEFDSTVTDNTGAVLGGVADGNRLASVPEFSAAATASYTMPMDMFGNSGDLFFTLSYQHVGDRITQPGDQVAGAGTFAHGLAFGELDGSEVTELDLELPSYDIVNFNVGFEADDWEVLMYLNNATDEDALLSFDRERGGRARLGYRSNQPATFGVTYRRRF